MLTRGEYKINGNQYGLICYHSKEEVELIITLNNNVWSAYKKDILGEYAYGNKEARKVWTTIRDIMKGCTAKNGVAAPFKLGTVSRHSFTKSKLECTVDKYNGSLAGLEVREKERKDDLYIYLEYLDNPAFRNIDIPYIGLATKQEFNTSIKEEEEVVVRTLEEISLEKDTTWLNGKKYYIINDDETAEKLFSQLDNWKYPIAYDTETTGLKINMFSKVNSKWQKQLEEYNRGKEKEDQIRADRLVGIIFCVEEGVSYYFPCFNRKFKNLYEDKDSTVRKQTIQRVKSRYTIGDLRYAATDMARYWRNVSDDEVTSDCILMERCRDILEKGHIVAHNGSFEWKVSYCYDIIINLKDDTMILHQVMYKFRSTTSNRGEPSNLKYLTKREFGIDQLDLSDFFVDYKEDDSGKVRNAKKSEKKKSKKKSTIDFSYMDYEGTKAYAPADGDTTIGLLFKYKRDLIENHKELEYIYSVEVIVACAVGYMEFFGHRLSEEKINSVREKYVIDAIKIEYKIRKLIKVVGEVEEQAFEELDVLCNRLEESESKEEKEEWKKRVDEQHSLCREIISNSESYVNLASPIQVATLFYDKLGYPFEGDKKSVAEKKIKPLSKAKNEDGTDKYPAVALYMKWKSIDTLLTKFFDNLPDFMYPGGYVFSSYGQISTATGRMSCRHPNAQQYPKDITGIVVPRENYVMFDADYSQIEYRTLVAMAGEEKLAEMFKDPDNDYHTLMASLMYGVPYASVTPKMRGDAKSFNFGIPYGMGFKSLAILLTGMDGTSQVEEAKEKYELYFKDQPNVRAFFNRVKEMALVNKYTKTYWNRYRYYSFTDKDGNISNKRKSGALRQAGNAVIQGTAADIFKISVARNYTWIKNNGLLGDVLIINMVHDEQLLEVNCDKVNTQRMLRDILHNMEFSINGFPPLYIGAGFGESWKIAKDKMAEIHPHLAHQLADESDKAGMSLRSDYPASRDEVIEYYNRRIYDFRVNKIKDYVLDESNYGKELHPAVGNLINLQFTYGLEKEKSKDELTFAALAKFIEVHNLGVDPKLFSTTQIEEEKEEEKEYFDELDEDDADNELVADYDFALIDEDETLYGIALNDLIREFGLLVSKEQKVCGIDTRILSYNKKDELIDYLQEHATDSGDDGAMQVIFLRDNNVLFNTGVWVNGIDGSTMSAKLKLNALLY